MNLLNQKRTPKELNGIKNILDSMNDTDKLKYLTRNIYDMDFKIYVDNDFVSIYLGEDEEGESIDADFDTFGHDLLVTIFNNIGFRAELV